MIRHSADIAGSQESTLSREQTFLGGREESVVFRA